jgi:hypothetical protein
MAGISVRTRKRLWLRSGGRCAFPGCDALLLEPTEGGDDDTIVGVECHIVSQQDSPTVARSESSLTPEERVRFAGLVEDRHGYANLVLMCANHSAVIDNPQAGYDVARVVDIKREHEATVDAGRSSADRRAGDLLLRNAAIVDGWEARVVLDEWQRWLGPVFGDGHPRMDREDFDRLSETRRWMFSRVWPGTEPLLEEAFENFRHVAQDLQLVFEQYPHEVLAEQGVVAPQRFYNDPGWVRRVGDHQRLDEMYEWYAYLLEDLALELTRAANLVCEAVRRTIDPRYRLDEGLVTLESGPYMDFMTRLHRPRYAAADGWSPYPGLRRFVTERSGRDEYRDSGDPPEGLQLPGESPFVD